MTIIVATTAAVQVSMISNQFVGVMQCDGVLLALLTILCWTFGQRIFPFENEP